MASEPVLFLLVGLPGSGKTTRAREIERTHRALRLSPDEWMLPLFGESDPDGKRDIMEGRLIMGRVARHPGRGQRHTRLRFLVTG